MIRANEAAGLTAALARSIDLKAADFNALLQNDVYRYALGTRGLTVQARLALNHLQDGARALGALANALAEPAEPAASTLGDRVADRIAAALRAAPASGEQP